MITAFALVLALSLASEKEIGISLTNNGSEEILIPIGMRLGTGDHANLFTLKIRTADGKVRRVIHTGVGAVAGYMETLTIGLRAGETYVVKVPMDRYYVLDGSEKLAAFLKRKCEVWVELEIKPDQCPAPAKLDSLRKKLPCWTGREESGKVKAGGW